MGTCGVVAAYDSQEKAKRPCITCYDAVGTCVLGATITRQNGYEGEGVWNRMSL